jgi:aminobenzoyl-glutamate utilization protein B
MLAEYDALPDCGPRKGEWGHGCGHNLLGTAAATGAVAAADVLAQTRRQGRVVVWGCPAEEILAGKIYMARDGGFRDNDAILAWHPTAHQTGVSSKGGAALDSILFEFHGRTAHAATAHEGRSAQDGVMLLDVAANYLREHVEENVRIHMCVLNGGDAPNVVPGFARSWYYVRGRDREQVDAVRKRLEACARGAAMASGTKVRIKRLTGGYSRLENDTLAELVGRNLETFGAPTATAADKRRLKGKRTFASGLRREPDEQGRASTDDDSVSWLAPFGRFELTCVADDTPAHHRDYAAQTMLPFAHRAMLRAAEVFAGTALDLLSDRALLRKAKAEFRKRTRGFTYDPLVPKRQKPPTVNP